MSQDKSIKIIIALGGFFFFGIFSALVFLFIKEEPYKGKSNTASKSQNSSWEENIKADKKPKEETIEYKVDWQVYDNKSTAYYRCSEFVKNRLKSPQSANFPSASEGKFNNTYRTGNEYQITSYVDSKNSYGVSIRTGFTCKIEQLNEDDWTLNLLEIDL